MKCKECGKKHLSENHYQLLSKLLDKGFPTHSKDYKNAHRKANKAEEKKFGKKSFKALEKIDRKVGKHELVGKNLKSGKIEVSKKVPKKLRKEVAFHEETENKILRKRKN